MSVARFCGLVCLWPNALAFAESTVIRYMDEDAGFMVLDKAPSDWKDGDKLCLFEKKSDYQSCETTFRWHASKALIYPPKASFEILDIGAEVEVRKILLLGSGAAKPLDVDTIRTGIQELEAEDSLKKETAERIQQNKFVKGSPPEIDVEAPTIEAEEFPEIFIPKLRKLRVKKERDTSESTAIKKGLKKSLKANKPISYQFASDKVDDPSAPVEYVADIPTPLSSAIRFSLLSAYPLLPLASYSTTRFRTITSDTVDRTSLWTGGRTQLEAEDGLGFQIQLISRMRSFVNFGWRYHNYTSLKSRATFDEFDVSLLALSRTRVSEQVAHVDWGRQQNWTDWFYTNFAFGTDVALSELKFDSRVEREGGADAFILANARKSHMTLAPRVMLASGLEFAGFGVQASLVLSVPTLYFRESFEGDVTLPERVRFQGSAQDDLKNALQQKRNTVATELLFGISYQPQRKAR